MSGPRNQYYIISGEDLIRAMAAAGRTSEERVNGPTPPEDDGMWDRVLSRMEARGGLVPVDIFPEPTSGGLN